MGTTWVLRTETKGTGAEMVPLERVTNGRGTTDTVSVRRKAAQTRKPETPQPRAPRRFRVVDVMTRERLVDAAGAKETLSALADVRSLVDVNVYVWEAGRERWRLLTLGEQRTMWELAHASVEPAQAP